MEETIDLKEYFAIIKKQISKIIAITLVTGAVAGVIGLLSKEEVVIPTKEERDYVSSSKVMISYDIQKAEDTIFKNEENKETVDIINRNINYNKSLLTTYAEMLKTNAKLDEVIDNLNLETSIDELKSNINITPVGESQLLNIEVKTKEPKLAMEIANEIPKVFTNENLEIKVIDKAIEPTMPVPKLDESGKPIPEVEEVEAPKPNKMKKVILNTVIGLVLGMMISLFVVFLMEYMDNKLRSTKQIENELKLPVLGVIPNTNSKKGGNK